MIKTLIREEIAIEIATRRTLISLPSIKMGHRRIVSEIATRMLIISDARGMRIGIASEIGTVMSILSVIETEMSIGMWENGIETEMKRIVSENETEMLIRKVSENETIEMLIEIVSVIAMVDWIKLGTINEVEMSMMMTERGARK